MIRGYCIGGGCGVAIGCDLRIAAEDAVFSIPAGRLGLGYRYEGIRRLTDLVGPAFATEIFFTARKFDAKEALAMGLINRLVAVGELNICPQLREHDRRQCAARRGKRSVLGHKDPEARDLALSGDGRCVFREHD
jgi:enoyl-CoA hydratase/carnithine racemase